MEVWIKRVYEDYSDEDGYRILVDRLWPRGVKKEDLKYDLWSKEIAPSNELRKWFNHDSKKWDEFKKKYFKELDEKRDLLESIINGAGSKVITLIYSAKNTEENQAVVIKNYIENKLDL